MRFNSDTIIARIAKNGFILLGEYRDAKTPMLVRCSCGKESMKILSSMDRSNKCIYCCNRLTLLDVQKTFSEQGCMLLATEYINNNTLMPYICSCGEQSEIILRNFKLGTRCKVCGLGKHTINTARKIFSDAGCELLATEYVNNHTDMQYICECGKIDKIKLGNFIHGQKCSYCANQKRKQSMRRYDFAYVASLFTKQGHELLTYIDTKSHLTFKCKCGRIDSLQGSKLAIHTERVCSFCRLEQVKSQHWRQTPSYRAWKLAVLYRDDYTCIKCGTSIHDDFGNVFHAHHINSPENEFLAYDEDNGATLCVDCHILYHSMYGKLNCTDEKFNKFMKAEKKIL